MKVPAGWDIGASTHTGKVRAANEDDFAVLFVEPALCLLVIADGMGGVSGGAEASRTAVRALCGQHLEAADGGDPERAAESMQAGFAEAGRRVLARSLELPALRDMGTTLTAARVLEGRMVVGHVGDTRLLRWRGGRCEALTRDHVLRPGQSILTNCIGAGQSGSSPDTFETEIRPGDVFALLTDGVWNTVADGRIARLFRGGGAQAIAEGLVAEALRAGAPDNATAVVFRPPHDAAFEWDGSEGAASEGAAEVRLPRAELAGAGEEMSAAPALRAPRWPWFVLAVAAVVGLWSWASLAGWMG